MKDEEKDLEEALKIVTEKVLEQLSTVQLGDLSGEITDIEAPACEKEVYPIYFDRTEKDNSKWLELLKEALKTAKSFEIHCWNGEVTPEFADMLLTMPKPQDTEIENKMTPFFNVFLDSGFQSSHYGTEVVIY